jgi:hypothetical protein
VEALKMFLLTARDFSDLEPSENMREIILSFTGDLSVEKILPALKKWRQLRHLTLFDWKPDAPRFDVLCDFIMGMKHLIYLRIALSSTRRNRGELESLREKVTEFAASNRPNLKLVIHIY